ncbi:MAG: CRTAC1 family protein, partial [Longimicrobiales bacterium]
IHSEDWIRIPGDRLRPRDGFYDIRITAELWETHFFDHVALMVVDHPTSTEALVDERFTLPPPELAVEIVAPLRPIARALDHRGRDVTGRVRARDGVHLDTFERGPYQGVAEDHWVEVELGDDLPEGPLLLVASGWIYPTDSSINLALAQGNSPAPRGLALEVADGRGGWVVVQPDLGFPAGKTKTVVLDLEGVFPPGEERRLRLRTNLEIYWDRITWTTTALPDAPVRTRRLLPSSAELRYRGFSEVRQDGRTAPELPVYGRIATMTPLWRDLVGYHTRFGDVKPLNAMVDDRYVIMNAGDELALRFPALPAPADGWTRDFVLIGDGWVKDGDYNTGFSTTVLPLPYHGMTDYADAPGRLEDDPAYRRHPEDWKRYHTRYVTPYDFHHALVPERD